MAVTLAVCALTLISAVSPYQRVRRQLPVSPRSGNPIVIDVDRSEFEGDALITSVVLHNRSNSSALSIRTELDGVVESHNVPPSASRKVSLLLARAGTTRLSIAGSHNDWQVESAEVSNVYGHTRGIINFAIVFRGHATSRAPTWAFLAYALFVAVMILGPKGSHSWSVRLLRVLAVAFTAFFALVTLAPVLSPFRVLLDPRTYALGLLVISLPVLVQRRRAPHPGFVSPRVLQATVVAAVALAPAGYAMSMMRQQLDRFEGNYSGFLHLTHQVAAESPFIAERPELRAQLKLYQHGYDGQFMYLMAFDPLMLRFANNPERYRLVVDFPPYRYGRIGFSALTRVFSRAIPDRFPATMMWLILAGHLLMGVGLALLTMKARAPAWTALLALAIPAYVVSLEFALPEALASGAVLIGLVGWWSRRFVLAVLAFAIALLIRETGLVLVASALLLTRRYPMGTKLRTLVCSVAPMVAWRLYVGWRLYPDWGTLAFLPSPGDFTMPFYGFWTLLSAVSAGAHPKSEMMAAIAFPLLLTAALALAIVHLKGPRSSLAIAATIYGVMAVSLNYDKIWMHVPSGERGTYELFLCLLVLGICEYRESPSRARLVVTLFLSLSLYTLFLSPESAMARSGLLLMR